MNYPYEGSKTLMHVFDRFEDSDLIAELLKGMYAELPEKKMKPGALELQYSRSFNQQTKRTKNRVSPVLLL